MPTYVYKFVETGETIEVQQAFTDEPLTEAVHPGRGVPLAVKKVFTPVGVTFKGDGFYKTDSRAASKAKAKPKPANGSSESSGTSSSDSSSSSSASSGSSSAPATASTGSSSSGSSGPGD